MISEQMRWEIFERDNFTCQKCGSRQKLSVDHIVPQSLGGGDQEDNLQTLCKRCNISKGNGVSRLSKPKQPMRVWSAARVSELRRRLGMDRAAFAALLDIHVSTLSRIEEGRTRVTYPRARELDVIERIADRKLLRPE